MQSTSSQRLFIPALGRLYASAHDGVETLLRVVAGGALMVHGSGKITNPFGAAGMVESLGFYPGSVWSLLLALTEFVGGFFLIIGFLTRPSAIAAFIVLMVTVYFHWIVRSEGYSGAELSIIWAAIMLFFAVRGGNRHSVDAKIGRAF